MNEACTNEDLGCRPFDEKLGWSDRYMNVPAPAQREQLDDAHTLLDICEGD
jgi:hypothetical protein